MHSILLSPCPLDDSPLPDEQHRSYVLFLIDKDDRKNNTSYIAIVCSPLGDFLLRKGRFSELHGIESSESKMRIAGKDDFIAAVSYSYTDCYLISLQQTFI